MVKEPFFTNLFGRSPISRIQKHMRFVRDCASKLIPYVELVEELIANLDKVEHETDLMQVDIRAALFKIEKDMNPVDVMFLYKIIQWVGDIADFAQMVGNRMLYLIAR